MLKVEEQDHVLQKAAEIALARYSIRDLPTIGLEEALEDEFDKGKTTLDERLKSLRPSPDWFAEIDDLGIETINKVWGKELVSILLGSSEYDYSHAIMLYDALRTEMLPGSVDEERFPIDQLEKFIQNWRQRVIVALERNIDGSIITQKVEKVSVYPDVPVHHLDALEILPELKNRYPDYIRKELASVKIIRKARQLFLETTVLTTRGEDIRRTDFTFIGNPLAELSTIEQAHRFLQEMDPTSISHITDLFRPDLKNIKG